MFRKIIFPILTISCWIFSFYTAKESLEKEPIDMVHDFHQYQFFHKLLAKRLSYDIKEGSSKKELDNDRLIQKFKQEKNRIILEHVYLLLFKKFTKIIGFLLAQFFFIYFGLPLLGVIKPFPYSFLGYSSIQNYTLQAWINNLFSKMASGNLLAFLERGLSWAVSALLWVLVTRLLIGEPFSETSFNNVPNQKLNSGIIWLDIAYNLFMELLAKQFMLTLHYTIAWLIKQTKDFLRIWLYNPAATFQDPLEKYELIYLIYKKFINKKIGEKIELVFKTIRQNPVSFEEGKNFLRNALLVPNSHLDPTIKFDEDLVDEQLKNYPPHIADKLKNQTIHMILRYQKEETDQVKTGSNSSKITTPDPELYLWSPHSSTGKTYYAVEALPKMLGGLPALEVDLKELLTDIGDEESNPGILIKLLATHLNKRIYQPIVLVINHMEIANDNKAIREAALKLFRKKSFYSPYFDTEISLPKFIVCTARKPLYHPEFHQLFLFYEFEGFKASQKHQIIWEEVIPELLQVYGKNSDNYFTPKEVSEINELIKNDPYRGIFPIKEAVRAYIEKKILRERAALEKSAHFSEKEVAA